jgi:NitT/TauT family transport system permease protein
VKSKSRWDPRRLITRDRLLVAAVFVFVVAAWELYIKVFNVNSVFIPAPAEVWESLKHGLSQPLDSRNGYWLHAGYTMTEAIGGFIIGSALGIVVGVGLAESRFLDVALRPYIVAFQSLPKVAVAPLVVVWLGFGMNSKIVITALLCFFPLVINTYTGLKAVDPSRLDLMRSMAASRWQTFRKVSFPGALPYVFAGLDMAVVFSLVGAIVGEFVGAQRGLGVLILQSNFSLDVAGVFAVFIVMSVLGVLLSTIVNMVRVRVVFWESSHRRTIGL